MKEGRMKRFVVAITGASGTIYGVRLVEALLAASAEHEVHLILSPAGVRVMADEMDVRPKLSPFDAHSIFNVTDEQAGRIIFHSHTDIGAGPASGTFPFEAMIVCPCSVKTLGAAAAGLADNLTNRAADVALKEGRTLVFVPRETPFSAIHLENMLRLSRAGAVILPANPGFYHKPADIEELVRYIVQKIFDRIGIPLDNPIRWRNDQ